MDSKNISRREFLRLSTLTAAGIVAAGCVAAPPRKLRRRKRQQGRLKRLLAELPAAQEVVLDCMSLAEYEGPYREIWNVFEAEHPDIKINVFSINEDTAAAYEAKVAGGYLPAIELTQETQIFFKSDNYEMAVDLSEIDFEWWDRWQFDAKNAWPDMFGLPGPRSLDCFQGYVMTWQYNGDLMEQAGLNPHEDVKSWDDLYNWMDAGTEWAAKTDSVDWFWNQAWHNWIFGLNYSDCIPLAFEDGSRQRASDCWMGKAKFNAEDSPYRHYYQFFLDAKDRGWIPEDMPTRQWEGDMEASYIAGKSVMMLHGPWVWDKARAAGSTFTQKGIPATPPAEGMATWMQGALPPNIDNQWWMRAGEQDLPVWPKSWSPGTGSGAPRPSPRGRRPKAAGRCIPWTSRWTSKARSTRKS